MAVDAFKALMFGSEDDAVFLGAYTKEASNKLWGMKAIAATWPEEVKDRGWVSEDGISLDLADSQSEIRGHQNHGVVKVYMSESDTSLKCTFLETHLETLVETLDITKGKKEGSDVVLDVPSSRKARPLCGGVDLYDVSGSDARVRIVLPHVQMGERTGMTFKVGDISAYEYNLKILGGFRIITNAPAIVENTGLLSKLSADIREVAAVPGAGGVGVSGDSD